MSRKSEFRPTLTLLGAIRGRRIIRKVRNCWSDALILNLYSCPEVNYAEMHGELKSANFPNRYPTNLLCYYFLHAPMGHHIELTFREIDICHLDNQKRCGIDELFVYEGVGTAGRQIFKLVGHLNRFDSIYDMISTFSDKKCGEDWREEM